MLIIDVMDLSYYNVKHKLFVAFFNVIYGAGVLETSSPLQCPGGCVEKYSH